MAKVNAAELKSIARAIGGVDGDLILKAAIELDNARSKVGRMKITIKKKDHVIRTIDHHNNRLNNDNRACRSALEKLHGENERLRKIIKELSESALRISGDFEKQIESSNEDLAVMEKMLQQLRAKDDENKRLRKALEFYANEDNNRHKIDFTVGEWEMLSEVGQDEGHIARQALNGEQHEPSTD